jgi:hypothetical protein
MRIETRNQKEPRSAVLSFLASKAAKNQEQAEKE